MQGYSLRLPPKQQWALLYQHQLRQYQRAQKQQKDKEKLRKLAFKQSLDHQRINKRSMSYDQKKEDYQYYQNLRQNAKKQQQVQERKKIESIQKRRSVQANNLEITQQKKNRHQESFENVYRIGMEDVFKLRRKNQANKKILRHDLQAQKDEKNMLKKEQKIKQLEKDLSNKTYQYQKQQDKLAELQKYGRYRQNIQVYNQYSQINKQKNIRENELEKKLVDIPAHEKKILEEERISHQNQQKIKKTILVRESLLSQIDQHNKSKIYKEDGLGYNNRMYEEFYTDKKPRFDRNQYLQTLNQQREQERRRKNSHKYMTQQEYKLNLDHLNKAINGHRSMEMRNDRLGFCIGNPEQISQRKDDIYFNKLGHRDVHSTEINGAKSVVMTEPKLKQYRQVQDQNDLILIRQKIQKLMMSRERATNVRKRC